MNIEFVKVEIFVPASHENTLIKAVNDGGFIREGEYDYSYSSTDVRGHFRPLEGSNPYSGQQGQIAEEAEVKLEFRIRYEDKDQVDQIIRSEHPYEVPVINYLPIV